MDSKKGGRRGTRRPRDTHKVAGKWVGESGIPLIHSQADSRTGMGGRGHRTQVKDLQKCIFLWRRGSKHRQRGRHNKDTQHVCRQHAGRSHVPEDAPFSSKSCTLAPRDTSSCTVCFRPPRAARWRGLRERGGEG